MDAWAIVTVPVDCPFCTLPASRIVWESPRVLAVRDAYAVTPGHTLVIPKRHIETYFDATPDEQLEVWSAVEEVKRDLDATLEPKPDGYNIGFNAGEAAGQTVMHAHVHVIPRYRGDVEDPRGGVRGVIPERQKY